MILKIPPLCGQDLWLEITQSRVHGEGNGTPLQHSCLENPMDGGAWWAAVHGVAEGRTRLSDFPFTFYVHALEKEMATHSSVLAWRIPGTGEPGGLLSLGSHRVRHDWSDLAAAAAAAEWNQHHLFVNKTLHLPVIFFMWTSMTLSGLFKNNRSLHNHIFLNFLFFS